MTHDIMETLRVTEQLLATERSFVTVTLLDIRGSAPQIPGAKAIVTAEGLAAGTIGGGKIEAAAIEHAQRLIADKPKLVDLVTWNLQTEIGMTCGGEVKLFFELFHQATWPIAVYGAGHVAQSLVRLLTQLNCQVTCVDPRSDWLARLPDHPKLRKLCHDEPAQTVAAFPEQTFFVLMSKGHATDFPVLKEILTTRHPPYVGVIGSEQKASVLRRDLRREGVTEDQIDRFFCPIGLPLGNNTTAEISISIAAQLIQVRDELGIFQHPVKKFRRPTG